MTGDRALGVLNLVANRWWTGSADPALRLTLALRARGHHALLGLAPGDKFEAKAREAGVEPVEGLRLDVRSGPAVLADLRRLRRLVREEALDVIHVHHSHDHWLGWGTHGGGAPARPRLPHRRGGGRGATPQLSPRVPVPRRPEPRPP